MGQGEKAMAGTGQGMTISIAMATYNGAKFLREQLDSFSAQTRLPDELVVCDDGSKDATLEILETFAASAPFAVRVIRNPENLGFVRNFEKALSLCSGDLIFLSDQDDVWLPEKLATVEAEFRADPKIMVTINDMIITDGELNHNNVTQLGNIRATGFGEQRFLAGCCVAMRNGVVSALVPFPDKQFTHDGWIGDMSVALGVRKIVDRPLQLYRRHGANESQWLLSDPKGVSRAEMVLKSGLASPLKGWTAYLDRLKVMRKRLQEGRAVFDALGLAERIGPALAFVDGEEWRYGQRIHLLSLPRWRRWVSVIGFWARGGYRRFAGWKSAVKDMIRP